jgi:hypothetical protein
MKEPLYYFNLPSQRTRMHNACFVQLLYRPYIYIYNILMMFLPFFSFCAQKYRLHTRRPSPSPQAAGAQAPQLVVLGGIWVPPEYATAAHTGAQALYGAHATPHAPTHYCAQPVPQEYYAAAPPVPPQPHHQLHHHTLHHQLHHVYNATSHAHSSPESDVRGTGDRSESIEDGKSESSSWKGESGEINGGGERKGLAALREDGEESNGSGITLKF